jgi:hypothetical protein
MKFVESTPRPQRPGRPMSNRELVEQLCASSPGLRESRRVHVERYGTLVPHVFMAEVVARVGCCCRDLFADAQAMEKGELESILAALEQGIATGDLETRNVIALSFIDDAEQEVFFAMLRPLLGPRLLAQVQGK